MAAPLHRQTIVFIVRVWAEYLNDQPPCWRGVIEGCEQGELNPFTSIEQMTQIIQKKSESFTQTPDGKKYQDESPTN